MVDGSVAARARMACRVYLKLHDAGPAGAPLTMEDALGPRDDPDGDLHAALAVISRFMNDTILDAPDHAGGVPHYALTAVMRARMEGTGGAGGRQLAERIRDDLRRYDKGDRLAPLDLVHVEVWIRTGDGFAPPL